MQPKLAGRDTRMRQTCREETRDRGRVFPQDITLTREDSLDYPSPSLNLGCGKRVSCIHLAPTWGGRDIQPLIFRLGKPGKNFLGPIRVTRQFHGRNCAMGRVGGGVRGWKGAGKASTVPTSPPLGTGSHGAVDSRAPAGPEPGPRTPRFALGAWGGEGRRCLRIARFPGLGEGPERERERRPKATRGGMQTRHIDSGWELRARTFGKSTGASAAPRPRPRRPGCPFGCLRGNPEPPGPPGPPGPPLPPSRPRAAPRSAEPRARCRRSSEDLTRAARAGQVDWEPEPLFPGRRRQFLMVGVHAIPQLGGSRGRGLEACLPPCRGGPPGLGLFAGGGWTSFANLGLRARACVRAGGSGYGTSKQA
ncbi:hypothetical protein Cadr_000014044 [Camelus dromedarius]|uniref:Uncharacterized protein n=1 Tax=Camelus dromedarius TaxID=9838 RepID=A0A5N4DE00_CAMDR|nr:hypothetical protein Cadr_000014044 [Camelus dromedarius]